MILTKKNFQESKLNKSCFCLQLFPFKICFCWHAVVFFPFVTKILRKKYHTNTPALLQLWLGSYQRLPPLGCPEPFGNAPRIFRSGPNQWSWEPGVLSTLPEDGMLLVQLLHGFPKRNLKRRGKMSQIMSWWRNSATCEVASKFQLNYIFKKILN